jgi:Toprim domain
MLGLDVIDRLTGGRVGVHDVACPRCGPTMRTLAEQWKRVLRVWRIEDGFAAFYCVPCGETGYARDRHSAPADPAKVARARAERDALARTHKTKQLRRAKSLWSHRQPIAVSIAETYLREARGYGGPSPATLAFVPAGGQHLPAMIGGFGLAHEVEPGIVAIRDQAIVGVHLTRLKPDGSEKATFEDPHENAKKMVGLSAGLPIVLAPPNDLLSLAIPEGIENGLSLGQDTGLGVWCAGAASRMPALANAVPRYIEFIVIIVDGDEAGPKLSAELAEKLCGDGVAARAIMMRSLIGEAA